MSVVIVNPSLFETGTTVHLVNDFGGSWPDWLTYQQSIGAYRTLTVPAGFFECENSRIATDYPGATIQGAGADVTTLNNLNGWCNHGIRGMDEFGDGQNGGPSSPRIETASAGATSITLIDPASYGNSGFANMAAAAARFSVGTHVFIAGVDVQAFGFPINQCEFEYNVVTSIDDETGVIGLETPLTKDYKSTWPHWYDGGTFHPDQCGWAVVMDMHPDWDSDFILRDVTLISDNGAGFIGGNFGRSQLYERCIFPIDQFIPTEMKSFIMRDCEIQGFVELDKITEYVEYDGCTALSNLQIQSACLNHLVIKNSDIVTLGGTPRRATISDTHIGTLILGPLGYGATIEPMTFDNVVADTVNGNLVGRPMEASNFTLANSVLTIPFSAMATDADVMGSMVPGAYIIPGTNNVTINNTCGPVFKVTDIELDGSDFVITTTLPDPCPHWDDLPISGLIVHPAPWMTVTNSPSGGLRFRNYAAADERPYGCYYKTDEITFIPGFPFVEIAGTGGFGYLEQITINVTKAYTGVLSTLELQAIGLWDPFFPPMRVIHEDTTISDWRPIVNLKVTGSRVLTSGSIVGAQSGDDLDGGFTGDHEWTNVTSCGMSADISGEDPSVWPEIEIEVILNHDIPPP